MKRLLVMLGVVAFLAALPLSHLAWAEEPCLVPICHVNSANDVFSFDDTLLVFGRVIEIDENAVQAHLDEHGDSLFYETLTEEEREALELELGITLPNANCFFCVTVNGA